MYMYMRHNTVDIRGHLINGLLVCIDDIKESVDEYLKRATELGLKL